MKPPATAPVKLPSPPTPTIIKAATIGLNPINGSTEPRRSTHSTPAISASKTDSKKAKEINLEAFDGKKIQFPIHVDTIPPEPTLVKYHFVLTPTNHYLQFKDHFCLVFAEI